VLGSLGMPTAFTSQADFTAMSTEPALCIDDVVHETFIAVDEKGTEALTRPVHDPLAAGPT
jgi:serpin B